MFRVRCQGVEGEVPGCSGCSVVELFGAIGRGGPGRLFAREIFSFSRAATSSARCRPRDHGGNTTVSENGTMENVTTRAFFIPPHRHFHRLSSLPSRCPRPAGPQAGLRVSSSSIYGYPLSVSTFSRRAARDRRRRRADASHVTVKGEGVARVSVVARVVRVAGCSGRVGEVTG